MRILIADHRQDVRAALELLLTQEPGIHVVGESATSQELLASLESVCPDVVLLDCELSGLPMADLLAKLRAHASNPRVLILCSKAKRAQAALPAGDYTVIDKRAHPKRLVTTLRGMQLESEHE